MNKYEVKIEAISKAFAQLEAMRVKPDIMSDGDFEKVKKVFLASLFEKGELAGVSKGRAEMNAEAVNAIEFEKVNMSHGHKDICQLLITRVAALGVETK